jgi:isopentenyldiphosphate isomerase
MLTLILCYYIFMTIIKDEVLDLVNENDEIIGQMERGGVYENNLNNFRVINCFIKNSEGKLWIPKRQTNKRMFPNCLDVSCGGHVSTGETYEEAFAKEMSEELNIDISKLSYKVLGRCNPRDGNMSAFMYVYEIESNDSPNYNQDDFQSFEWLTPQELMEKINNKVKAKQDLPKLIKKFYLK